MKKILMFDDECMFCNSTVQFIIKKDPKRIFYFTPLNSDKGKTLKKKHSIPLNIDSFFLIKEGRIYDKSSAALHVFKELKGPVKLLQLFLIIPKPLRDIVYKVFSKNRYKIKTNRNSCPLPNKEIRDRFLY